MTPSFDRIDLRILQVLQQDASLSQRGAAERVGLSQNTYWRRLRRLNDSGVIKGQTVVLDREQLGAVFVAFVLIKTKFHASGWVSQFGSHVQGIPQVTDFCRISGEYDYLLKVVTVSLKQFDAVYQRLIEGFELQSVTSFMVMEAIAENRPIAFE